MHISPDGNYLLFADGTASVYQLNGNTGAFIIAKSLLVGAVVTKVKYMAISSDSLYFIMTGSNTFYGGPIPGYWNVLSMTTLAQSDSILA